MTRAKGLEDKQESTDEEKRYIQEEKAEKKETMKPTTTAPFTFIPSKNRFDILQYQKTSKSQPQLGQTKEATTSNAIVELIKKKKRMRYEAKREDTHPPHHRSNQRRKRGKPYRTTKKAQPYNKLLFTNNKLSIHRKNK